jgi:hypothetical protein
MKKGKRVLIASVGFLVVLIGFVVFFYQNAVIAPYYGKTSNLVHYEQQDEGANRDFYIMGTIHAMHFTEKYNYAIAEIKSVIDTLEPDLILVEVRQETVDQYGALDGPIDMIYAWCYAKEKNIDVKGIDYWSPAPGVRSNSTDDTRDDKLFENVLLAGKEGGKILVVCGAQHRINFKERFINAGYRKSGISNISNYFGHYDAEHFQYPDSMAEEIVKKIEWANSGFVEEVKSLNAPDTEDYNFWMNNTASLVESLEKQLKDFVIPSKLYGQQ